MVSGRPVGWFGRISLIVFFSILMPGTESLLAKNPIRVLTTTTDLAHLASRVGGDLVESEALIRGDQDPHFIDARPDYILKASRADVFCMIGLELETGWEPLIRSRSRNAKIMKGGPGYCDASQGVHVLEVPVDGPDRAMGDVHAMGNPHYHPDPLNALIAARNIRDALVRTDPEHRDRYEANFNRLAGELKAFTMKALKEYQDLKGAKVAVHHREFVYFANRFGIQADVSLEEKAGVPPGAVYLKKVIEQMKKEQIRVILLSPWNNRRYADSVAAETGAKVVVMPISVGSMEGINTYEQVVDGMLSRIRAALGGG